MDAEKLGAVRQLQQRFPALTVSEARELLQSHRWNVTAALSAAATREREHATASREGAQAYFVGGAGQGGSAQQVMAAPSPPHTDNNNNNNSGSGSVSDGDVQRLIEQVFAKAARRAGAEGGGGDHRDYLTAKGTAGAAAAAAAARDMAGKGDDNGDDDDDGGDKDDDEDDADGTRVQAFYGHGRRLGYTSHPSPRMAPTLRRTRGVVIAAYRNGFLIDDTLFVPLQSADGAAFARALQQGHIPDILAQRYPDCDITAKLHDCMTQDYSAPSYAAFTGTGHRLSDSTSSSTTTAAPSAPATASSPATATAAAIHVPTLDVVDGGDDVTTVCLVTMAGAKHEVRVNATRHTVDDLYRVASALQQQQQPSASPALLLVVRDRPPRKLGSDTRTMTIEQAKLKRAVVIIQKDTS